MTFTIFTSNAGHSPKSPGACTALHREYEQNRLNNKAFIKAMAARGVKVTDTTSDASDQNEVLREQVRRANALDGGIRQLDLSFHLNSGGGTGVEVLYVTASGKKTAEKIAEAVHEATGLRNRGAKKRTDLYFLNATHAVANLVEVCFLDSRSDMAVLERNRAKIFEAIADALVDGDADKQAYKGPSLVDYLESIGVSSSFGDRAHFAVSYGIVKNTSSYQGTAEQNTALLHKMRGY